MSSSKKSESAGTQVLRFLDEHRLEHSPAHYAFAHRFLSGKDRALRDEVAKITDDGVRITADQVTKLASRADSADGAGDSVAPQLDRLTLRLLDIVADAASATGDLNRELVTATTSMLGPDAPSIRLIVATMIERTARAEASMAEATRQAQTLRDELNAVRNDATQDRLTGLSNRAAIEERLTIALTTPGGCSVAFVDVDRFKAINDAHGHAVGDRVLKVVAETLHDGCAPHAVGRWGGEEFLVVFDGLSAVDSARIVDKAREALTVRHLKLREDDAPLGSISFSAGVASSRSREAASLVAAADRLLYQAKAQGRNRVVVEPAVVEVESR